jgi:ribose transport system ATP-binding protein
MEGMTHDKLISKMVGREIELIKKETKQLPATKMLQVQNLSLAHPENAQRMLVNNVSLKLSKGEVLGIFGLMGAGRTELLETVFGLRQAASGQLKVEGRTVNLKSPAEAMKTGIALVPEDRKKDGLVLGMDVKTNISLTTLDSLQNYGLLDNDLEEALAKKYIGLLKIKTSSPAQLTKTLSGGNQQKIVLAKYLAMQPKILMLDEPTRGIDINAKNEIYKLTLELAASGLGIIFVSSELPEILAVSDRILVMAEGSITAEFAAGEATEDNVLKAAIPKTI